MSRFYRRQHGEIPSISSSRGSSSVYQAMELNLETETLDYLDEAIINHLYDSFRLMEVSPNFSGSFCDYSFCIAPAYKAFEGFLIQLAKDLKLPSSGQKHLVGSFYYDEQKIDKQIDDLINEFSENSSSSRALSEDQKYQIKDSVKDMKRFLTHYRHAPAHFNGEPIDTLEKANQIIISIYRIFNETVRVLLQARLIDISDQPH